MKVTDDLLDRLLEAAANARPPEPDEPSFAFEGRAIAAWRTSRAAGDGAAVRRFLRIGLGFASVLTAAIIVLSLRNLAREPAAEFGMPNAALDLALVR